MIFDGLYEDTLSSLAHAVQTRNLPVLKELLQNGHSSNLPDNRGWTPLHVAAFEGYVLETQELLTAEDADIERMSHNGLSPLYLACSGTTESHREVVELLLSAGADPDMSSGDKWVLPLHTASENNNLEVVRMLLDAGANPNIVAYKSTTALHAAAEVGALEIAQMLLEKGGDLNITHDSSNHSALHCLCLHYRQDKATVFNDMLDLYISHGSDINAQMKDGSTPLMLAVQERWDRAVDTLLQRGADVYLMKADSVLVLHFAVQFSPDTPVKRTLNGCEDKENSSVFQKILSRTSTDRIPRDGFSIFHLAIQWKRYEEMQALIEVGLNPDEFLQEMEGAIIDCDESDKIPLVVQIHTCHDTPLGFLLFQSLTREVVDTAKYMIDKGSSISALRPDVLPPLVAALKNRHPASYDMDGLGQEILQYLLSRGADIMHKIRENDILPAALTVSSLFNVVGFFRLLQHGVPAHHLFTRTTLISLAQHYQDVPCYKAYQQFPWLVISWLRTANLFIPQLPVDTTDIFDTDWNVSDENLTQAWHELGTVIASPKSLQQLCALKMRLLLARQSGWGKLQHALNKLHVDTRLPDPILDLLHFKWVKTNTLQQTPPPSAMHLYVTASPHQLSSDDEL